MNKILYIISLIVLVLSGYLFILSGIKWVDTNRRTHESHVSILDAFQTMGTIETASAQYRFPLVEKAMEFALYLNPPQISNPEPIPAKIEKPPVYRPTNITPKFRLLSTSYYISNPEKSVALVSEPGKGDHWIRKGERVGNFIVEEIKNGSIIYRDNNQLVAMNVIVKQNTPIGIRETRDEGQDTPSFNPDFDVLSRTETKDGGESSRVLAGTAETSGQINPIGNNIIAGDIFNDSENPEEEYSSPIRSVRQNSKKNIRPGLRLLYAEQE